MAMNILLIGGAGFVGQCLSEKLTQRGRKVVVMDLRPPDKPSGQRNFVRGDILKKADFAAIEEKIDAIVHLAAKHHDFGVTEEEFFGVNVSGTRNALDYAAEKGIRKIVFYSTVAVYGPYDEPVTEEMPPNPVNPYGRSKLDAERLVAKWAADNKEREAAIIRPTVVFGPNNYANMHNLMDSIWKRKFVFVGQGCNIKSVAYVENLADATMFLLERLKPGVKIYNYSDYPQMTIRETVKVISTHLSCPIPGIRLPLGPVLAAASVFDVLGKITRRNFPITAFRIKKFNTSTQFESYKIRKAGFRQSVSLYGGFKKMAKWYLSDKKAHIGRGVCKWTG